MIREPGMWALVDGLAAPVTGSLVERHPEPAEALDGWARDPDFWVRRSALLALLVPLRRGEGDFDRFAALADGMPEEREFFVRKAIDWVLREVGKKRPELVHGWLLPRASGPTVREAVKHLPEAMKEEIWAARASSTITGNAEVDPKARQWAPTRRTRCSEAPGWWWDPVWCSTAWPTPSRECGWWTAWPDGRWAHPIRAASSWSRSPRFSGPGPWSGSWGPGSGCGGLRSLFGDGASWRRSGRGPRSSSSGSSARSTPSRVWGSRCSCSSWCGGGTTRAWLGRWLRRVIDPNG